MAKEMIPEYDYEEYIKYIKSLIDMNKELSGNDDYTPASTNLESFEKELENKDFVSISKNNTKTIDFQVNPQAKLESTDSLEQLGETSIKRRNKSISVSNHNHSYHAGSSSKINIGNKTSITNLNKDYKETSITSGKTTSIVKGNTSSKTLVRGEEKVSIAQESSSINIFHCWIKSWKYTGLSTSALARGNNFYQTDTPFNCSVDSTGLGIGLNYIPFKGHFTAVQTVLAAVYADIPHTENLYRIFNLVYTAWDVQRDNAAREELTVLEQNMYTRVMEAYTMDEWDGQGATSTTNQQTLKNFIVGFQETFLSNENDLIVLS